MLSLPPSVQIYVASEPADMRKSFNGLTILVNEALEKDPLSGHLFVFRNRRRTSLKLLCYDGQGFWLCQKRLSQGRFRFWPNSMEAAKDFQAHELQVLLSAGDPAGTQAPPPWRRVNPQI